MSIFVFQMSNGSVGETPPPHWDYNMCEYRSQGVSGQGSGSAQWRRVASGAGLTGLHLPPRRGHLRPDRPRLITGESPPPAGPRRANDAGRAELPARLIIPISPFTGGVAAQVAVPWPRVRARMCARSLAGGCRRWRRSVGRGMPPGCLGDRWTKVYLFVCERVLPATCRKRRFN